MNCSDPRGQQTWSGSSVRETVSSCVYIRSCCLWSLLSLWKWSEMLVVWDHVIRFDLIRLSCQNNKNTAVKWFSYLQFEMFFFFFHQDWNSRRPWGGAWTRSRHMRLFLPGGCVLDQTHRWVCVSVSTYMRNKMLFLLTFDLNNLFIFVLTAPHRDPGGDLSRGSAASSASGEEWVSPFTELFNQQWFTSRLCCFILKWEPPERFNQHGYKNTHVHM